MSHADQAARFCCIEWIAQQISEAFPWDEAPRHLIRDRDTSYGAAVIRRL